MRLIILLKTLLTLVLVMCFALACQPRSSSQKPAPVTVSKFTDIHIHYNFTQEEVTSKNQAIKILKKHQVVLAVVSSEPTNYALKIANLNKKLIIPFASPYYKPGIKLHWYYDKNLLTKMRVLLATGQYKGIGEVHLTAGIGPRPNNKNMLGLLNLAREFKLPFLIHTDSSDPKYMQVFCAAYPSVRFIWAHAGGILGTKRLTQVMNACPNVWLDMAARDPWRYGLLTDNNNKLLPGWREFFIKYQNRIMTGTDPVWNAHQAYKWYEADEGWNHYTKLINFHRNWMKQLPLEVEKKIRLTNTLKFFNKL